MQPMLAKVLTVSQFY